MNSSSVTEGAVLVETGATSTVPGPVQEAIQEGVSYWAKRWEEKRTGWHLNAVNPNLIKHIDWLTRAEEGGAVARKILVPLCGQTHDLLYLLGLGHEVFAIEAVPECIQVLNERDGLKLNFNEPDSIYQTEDEKLKIYCGDIFECPIEKYGPFDAIWDRGSFIAIEYSQRKAYAELMRRSVCTKDGIIDKAQHDFRYVLDGVEYDKSLFGGPPRSILESDMAELYSPWTHLELVSKKPVPEQSGLRKTIPEGHGADEVVYFLSPD